MAGKNASWWNLVTCYKITTACLQARDCTKPGCAKDILWAASGACMWHRIKAPVCEGCGQTAGCVLSGRHPSGRLARHAPPASLLPLSRVPEGLSQEVKLIASHDHAKLKTIQPPEGNIYKHNVKYTKQHRLCGPSLAREHQVQNPKEKVAAARGKMHLIFQEAVVLSALPSRTMHWCLCPRVSLWNQVMGEKLKGCWWCRGG